MKKRKQAQRKKTRREKKKRQVRSLVRRGSGRALLRAAGDWPLHECLLTQEWQEAESIVQILVARRSPRKEIACAVFLVDLGCLGVKSAFASKIFSSVREYRRELRDNVTAHQDLVDADPNLVAKIVHEGVAYARGLGFRPDPDYRDALLVLGDADPDACDVPIPLGDGTGKPLFIAGPYDNVPSILARLRKAVGEGNFDYVVFLGGEEMVWEE